IFIANVIASLVTFLIVLPMYFKIGIQFDVTIWKNMIRYAIPVHIAGIAYTINEGFDKILLKYLLPEDVAERTVGIYAACYNLGAIISLYVSSFMLFVESFFFSHAISKISKVIYDDSTLYFYIFVTLIFLFVAAYSDVYTLLLIPIPAFWDAIWVVPFIL